MDIRSETCLIVKRGTEYLVGTILYSQDLRWSDSPWSAWRTRSREQAEKVARVTGGRDGAAVYRDRGDADAVDEGGMSMQDSEKVIKELEERIKAAEECKGNLLFTPDAIRTIVALLKEQQAEIENWIEAYSFEH